jgi:large subunit ribosomal protein L11
VNPGQFVMQFNERTKALNGMPVTAVVNVYSDRSFDFIIKSPPAAVLLKDAAKVAKGSGMPNKEKVGKVTRAQVAQIAKTKLKDLNCFTMEAAERIIAGTARNMGIEIET